LNSSLLAKTGLLLFMVPSGNRLAPRAGGGGAAGSSVSNAG